MRDAYIKGAKTGLTDFRGANFAYVDLSSLDLRHTLLQGAVFEGACLSHADLSGKNLKNTCFKKASFDFANLQGCDFTGSNFEVALFFGTNLVGTNFTDANMTFARIQNAVAVKTDFTAANTHGLYFRPLYESNLVGAVQENFAKKKNFLTFYLEEKPDLKTLFKANPKLAVQVFVLEQKIKNREL